MRRRLLATGFLLLGMTGGMRHLASMMAYGPATGQHQQAGSPWNGQGHGWCAAQPRLPLETRGDDHAHAL